jgi:Vitamin B6 photo-protection and homoeostasis
MKPWNASWSLVVFLIKPAVHGFVPPLIQYASYQPRLLRNPFFDSARYDQKNVEQQQEESTPKLPTITQVDVIYGSTTSLVYDENEGRFLPKEMIRNKLDDIQIDSSKLSRFILAPLLQSPPVTVCRKIMAYHVRPYLTAAFVPAGVTPAYYRYTTWRFLQRWINANLQVFGTQSLLLGLGIKTKSLAALSAALNWVLKDALGKIVRMFWASKMGGRFDSDAKRWRMRASFLYAVST